MRPRGGHPHGGRRPRAGPRRAAPHRTAPHRTATEAEAGDVTVTPASGFRVDHVPYGGFEDGGVGTEDVECAADHFSRETFVGFHAGFN